MNQILFDLEGLSPVIYIIKNQISDQKIEVLVCHERGYEEVKMYDLSYLQNLSDDPLIIVARAIMIDPGTEEMSLLKRAESLEHHIRVKYNLEQEES